ncbi:MAG: hypothetical protein OCD01_20375 [Fibrobacterales bacterium]
MSKLWYLALYLGMMVFSGFQGCSVIDGLSSRDGGTSTEIPNAVAVSGTVNDTERKPVAGTIVSLHQMKALAKKSSSAVAESEPSYIYKDTTDAEGYFNLFIPNQQSVTLDFLKQDESGAILLSESITDLELQNDVLDISVDMQKPGTLQFEVILSFDFAGIDEELFDEIGMLIIDSLPLDTQALVKKLGSQFTTNYRGVDKSFTGSVDTRYYMQSPVGERDISVDLLVADSIDLGTQRFIVDISSGDTTEVKYLNYQFTSRNLDRELLELLFKD